MCNSYESPVSPYVTIVATKTVPHATDFQTTSAKLVCFAFRFAFVKQILFSNRSFKKVFFLIYILSDIRNWFRIALLWEYTAHHYRLTLILNGLVIVRKSKQFKQQFKQFRSVRAACGRVGPTLWGSVTDFSVQSVALIESFSSLVWCCIGAKRPDVRSNLLV